MSYDDTIKIMLLGDESVEKTSLVIKYISGFFLDDVKLTTGIDFYSKTTIVNDKKIKLQIWDFGGEERYRFLLHQYCKNARGGLFVFNIADSSSIDHIDDWLSAIRQGVGTKVFFPILVVGLLPDDENMRKVSTEEGVKITESRNLNGYIECDLKTGKNIEEVFEKLARLILADTSYTPSQRKVEDLSIYCSKCKKLLTTEEFLNHPCFTTGAVNVRGAIMGDEIFLDRVAAFKISLVGEKGVGKSTFANRYLIKTFDEDIKRTVGADFYSKDLEIDGKNLVIRFWVISEELRFKALVPRFLSGSDGIFIMFDVSRLTSLNQIDRWIEAIKTKCYDIPIILLGNKADLTEHLEPAKILADSIVNKYGLTGYYEISTLNSKNMELILATMAETILKSYGL